ncbi:MFS transporter [Sphingomonas canadensis]|uniref:MFS transporter n=1 Tax=Sphingomonas canadensis TaxID=1219257 RepID=A0ABW3H8D6_9SPHN|nr:MFS transporter [Sphingomonas canadensis]MCW3835637.1 MFS transporter [Sphingomonas canadensis]
MSSATPEPGAAPEGVSAWYAESTPPVRRVFWTCSAAWALDAMDALVYQYLIPVLVLAFGMTLAEAGSIASANYFASALGGWMGGWLADRFGRVRVLQITILWFSFFSFLSGFAQDYEQLLAIRILQGLGFGAEWAVGAVLLGEMISPRHRGKALGVVHSGAAIGSGLAALLAGPVVMLFPQDLGWRVVFWIGLLPAALVFFLRRGNDDSPLFKAARERALKERRHSSPLLIFHPRYLRITALTALLALGAQGSGYAVSNYLTTFLTQERGLTISAAGFFVLVNSVGGFFGFLVNAYLSDRLGRATIFRLFGLGFVLTSAFYLYAPLGSSAWTLMPAGCIYGFFQFGIYASFGPYFTELFPTEVRANGQAFAYNFGRAFSFIFIQGVALLAGAMALSTGMMLMGFAGVICTVLATLLLPETAGRDLAELDRH